MRKSAIWTGSLAGGAKISPWYYFNASNFNFNASNLNASNPLVNGADVAHLIVLATATVIPMAAAAAIFHLRDLRS